MHLLFESWAAIGRSLVIGVGAYAIVVVFLRLTGKRTLSKWNAFDFIVTIALGSTLAGTILNKDITLAQGATGLGVLILLQFVVTWGSVRWKWVRRLLKSEPTLLLYLGQFQDDLLREERVTKSEVCAAIRSQGIGTVEEVAAVVLETDGTFSVIPELGDKTTTLDNVRGFDEVRARAGR